MVEYDLISYSNTDPRSINNVNLFASESLLNVSIPDDTDFELLPNNDISNLALITKQPLEFFESVTVLDNVSNALITRVSVTQNSTNGPYIFEDDTIKIALGQQLTLQLNCIDRDKINSLDLSGLTIIWRRDNDIIIESNEITITGTSINFSYLVNTDSGEYICELINRHGSVFSDSIRVEVIDPYNTALFYTNLIKNGYAQIGLSHWTDINNQFVVSNFGSFDFINSTIDHDYEFSFTDKGYNDQDSFNRTILIPSFNILSTTSSIDAFDSATYVEENNEKNAQQSGSIIANINSPYKKWATFFPNPIEFDRNNTIGNSSFTISDKIKGTYFSRPNIRYFRNGGSLIAGAYQDIDVSEYSDIIGGRIKGINSVSAVLFCYLGTGVTRVESGSISNSRNLVFEDTSSITVDFYLRNVRLHDYTYTLTSPSESEFMSKFQPNIDPIKLRGTSVVLGRRLYIPSLPDSFDLVRVTYTMKHLGTQQSDEDIKFNRPDIYLGSSIGDRLTEGNNPMGVPRNLVTALNLILFPNNNGSNKLLL